MNLSHPTPLTPRFGDALVLANHLHAQQFRKGSPVPYISHLLGVTALVLEMGGNEDEAIAALLHDAGFIHNDLHGGNIVLELRGGMWKPFLIDFGHCGHESLQNPFPTPEAIERGLENDVDDLVEAIRLPLVGIPQPPWVEKGIELLETVSVL